MLDVVFFRLTRLWLNSILIFLTDLTLTRLKLKLTDSTHLSKSLLKIWLNCIVYNTWCFTYWRKLMLNGAGMRSDAIAGRSFHFPRYEQSEIPKIFALSFRRMCDWTLSQVISSWLNSDPTQLQIGGADWTLARVRIHEQTNYLLTRALLGLWIFHRLLGGGRLNAPHDLGSWSP